MIQRRSCSINSRSGQVKVLILRNIEHDDFVLNLNIEVSHKREEGKKLWFNHLVRSME
jgi:hypothetical protein